MNSNMRDDTGGLNTETMNRIRSLVVSQLSEVETKTFEDYVQSYAGKTDRYINQDLDIQEQLASAYHIIIAKHPRFQMEQKVDTYKALLLLTMGMPDFTTIKNLTEEQLSEVNRVFEQTVLKVIQNIK